jgi:hypothetical protein
MISEISDLELAAPSPVAFPLRPFGPPPPDDGGGEKRAEFDLGRGT